MATAFTSDFAETPITRLGFNRIYTIYEAAAAFVINDTIKGPKLWLDQLIMDGGIACDDLDTHGTPTITLTLRVTDGTTPKNLISGSTVGQAGGVARMDIAPTGAAFFKITNANYYLELLVAAAPATGTATGTVCFWVDVHSQRQHGD